MEHRSVGNFEQPTAMAARQPTGISHRSAANVARSPAAKSAKVGARRPISETWTKSRPHAETSKENIGRKENSIGCTPSRSPFREHRFCSPATETVKAKRVGDMNTLSTSTSSKSKSAGSCERDVKRHAIVSGQQDSRLTSVRRRIDEPTVGQVGANSTTIGRRSSDDLGNRKSTSLCSPVSTGTRKSTVNSLFSKLGNLGEKIQLIQSQKVDLEASKVTLNS